MVPAMKRRRFPTGIRTLRELRERDCCYVDRTGHIERLIDRGKYNFLSRPRRFGKSLLVDTLKELFEGNAALFEGLHIHPQWDWSVRHPVVRREKDASVSVRQSPPTAARASGQNGPMIGVLPATVVRRSTRRYRA